MSYSLTGYTGYGKRDSQRLSFGSYGLKHSKARDVANPSDYQHKRDRKGNAVLSTNFPQRDAKYRDGAKADQIYALDCHLIRLCRELTIAQNSNKPERVSRLNKLIERATLERGVLADTTAKL